MTHGCAADEPGVSKALRGSAFPNDDGAADVQVRARLADPSVPVADALAGARLLVVVAQVPDEVDEDGHVHRHMGLVSMVNGAGERGLLAFTGIDSMRLWDESARPLPVSVADAAHAAFDHGAVALVIDVMGPVRAAVTGEVLAALAEHGHGLQ